MLAMVVNDDAGHLTPLSALRFIASMLAPTGVAAMGHPWPSTAKPASCRFTHCAMPAFGHRGLTGRPKLSQSQSEAA
jgi:hypothetical protein